MSLTCISCKLLFSVPELHQEHYKSDWHRYNLKRRIAELPPLTKEEFEERAAAFEATRKEKEKVSLKCDSCNKHFSSQNALSSHLKSKKHIELQAVAKQKPKFKPSSVKLSEESKAEGKNEDIDAFMLDDTGKKSRDSYDDIIDDNDEEEEDDGSDWESCSSDDDGVSRLTVDTDDCLFCGHQSDSTENNVKHMTEAHSFFIPDVEYVSDLDGLIGYLAGKLYVGHICLWCDVKGKGFKSVKAVRQHMIDKGHCKMLHEGEALLDYADFYDYSSSEARNERFDEDVISSLLQDSHFELVLPSGATVGHRSLAMYYKQNLRPITYDNEKKVKKVLEHYKAVGYSKGANPATAQKARDFVFMQRVKNRYNLKLGIKSNRFQPHFRSQVMF